MSSDYKTGVREDLIMYALLFIAVILYLFFLVPANMDLSGGGYHLFMDEQISFDAVQKILHPGSFTGFFKALAGGDQRYGRIMYTLSAFFSFLPEKIWGPSGQIITTRMLLFLFLLSAYLLLATTFIREKKYQLLAVIALLCIPSTTYYASLPKPEPFQLFFYALFLRYYIKNSYRPGIYFIWLGIAFGCKISLLFPLLFVFAYTLAHQFNLFPVNNFNTSGALSFGRKARGMLTVALFFIAGWFIAVPLLAFSFIRPSLFGVYLQNTFLNTSHGADDSKINILSWIKGIVSDWLQAPEWLSLLTGIVVLIVVLAALLFLYKKQKKEVLASQLVFLSVNALLFLVPILLLTKRLWFFYLHQGVVFFILAFFGGTEILLQNRSMLLRYFSFAAISLLMFFSVRYSYLQQVNEQKSLAIRTIKSDYLINEKRYRYFTGLLTAEKTSNPSKEVSAFADPQFFRYDSKNTPVTLIWGYFDKWSDGKNYVFLGDFTDIRKVTPPHPTNAAYASWRKAVAEYKKHTGDSAMVPAYTLLPQQVEGLYVYKRIK